MERTRIISFFSPKGGVGKTLISLNTAVGMALSGKRVVFVDFDLSAPQSTHKLLGISCKHTIFNLISLIDAFQKGEKDVDNYLCKHSSGLAFAAAISHTRERFALKPNVIKDFIAVFIDKYDYVIIDCGSNITDELITLFDLSNLILLLLTPDIASLYQVQWAIDTLQGLGFPSSMIKVILNRAESKGAASLQEVKLLIVPEIISLIPSDGRVAGISVNKKIPFIIDASKSRMAACVLSLCEDLMNKSSFYINRKELSKVRVEKTTEKEKYDAMGKVVTAQQGTVPDAEEDIIVKLKKHVHNRLIEEINLKKMPIETMIGTEKARALREKAEKVIGNIIADEAGGFISSVEVRKQIIKEILDEALGFGPLEDLLRDPSVTEVMVNNKEQVFIEKEGKIELTTKKFTSDEQVKTVIERILAPLGRRIDESTPYVDARLPDGSRVNAIIPPLSLTGPTLTIRKFSHQRLNMPSLINEYKSISYEMAEFLKIAVRLKKNILISGGTGSGKTTFLNILSLYIGDKERIVTIEDSAELKLDQAHWIRLESRPPNIEGKGEITIRDLFRNSLRMRPDRIIVGEVRGQEVLDMLQAMNTGHDGSISTIHANSTQDALIRLDSMILISGIELPIRAIREMVSSGLDLIVHTSRLSDGSRKVVQITELAGMLDETTVNMKDLFIFKQTGVDNDRKVIGHFTALGRIPAFYDDIAAHGFDLPKEVFLPK